MPIRLQSDAEGASKQDTRFLAQSATGGVMSELAVDLGQYFADFTDDTTSISEASSTRCDVTTQWTVLARVSMTNAQSGTIFNFANLRLQVDGSQNLVAWVNGAAVGTFPLFGLTAGARDLTVAFTTRPNPGSTGASDAQLGWLYVYNEATGGSGRHSFTHASRTASAGTARWNAQTAGGVDQFSGALLDVLFSCRCQSFTEIARDWFDATAAQTTGYTITRPPLPLDRSALVANEAHIHGPAAQWAARFADHAKGRHASPLVNTVYEQQPTIDTTTMTGATNRRMFKYAPGSSTYWLALGWFEVAVVPVWANAAWVRLHVRSWVTAGAAVPVGLRVYSMSRKPILPGAVGFQPPEPMEKYHTPTTTITRDDIAGAGQWDVQASVPLAIGKSGISLGKTYICPAFAFDPAGASGNDANARLQFRALHVIPGRLEDDGGLPLGGFNG